jgi:16S rRNA (guanine966-N2)-methyltransferase
VGASGELRIIAGRFRGRRLSVPSQPGLRPTPDRVRETLFNWLAPVITGARCLDLFAGSGALGFEAASRGAREVVLVERAPAVARVLRENARRLGAGEVRVEQGDALRWLSRNAVPFDIVFLDPPFDLGLLTPAFALLLRNGWLSQGAYLYLESPARAAHPELPPGWRLLRDKAAGQVRYALVRAPGEESDAD